SDDGRKVVGFLNNEQLGGTVLGRVSDLSRIARAEFIDEIIVACVGKSELKRRLIREARRQHLAVSIVPDYLDCESRNREFGWMERAAAEEQRTRRADLQDCRRSTRHACRAIPSPL